MERDNIEELNQLYEEIYIDLLNGYISPSTIQ